MDTARPTQPHRTAISRASSLSHSHPTRIRRRLPPCRFARRHTRARESRTRIGARPPTATLTGHARLRTQIDLCFTTSSTQPLREQIQPSSRARRARGARCSIVGSANHEPHSTQEHQRDSLYSTTTIVVVYHDRNDRLCHECRPRLLDCDREASDRKQEMRYERAADCANAT